MGDRLRLPQSALVGREREQRLLRERFAVADAGQGSLVLIGGEAGIGKTALVDSLVRIEADVGAVILSGHAYDLSITPPYGPWVEILRAYHPTATLPPIPRSLHDSQALIALDSQDSLFTQALDFFVAVAREAPLVLILEDLHWADSGSLEFLRVLARRLHQHRILLLATYRSDELTSLHPLAQMLPVLVRESQAERLNLPRLSSQQLRALVVLRYPLAESDAARLVDYLEVHADGNPFYALELLRTLEEEARLAPDGEGWRVGDLSRLRVPPLLRQVIENRLARLEPATVALLQLASVIGQVVRVDIWQAAGGVTAERIAAVLEQAMGAHLLEESRDQAAVRFSHALVREVLYTGMVLPRRQATHRQLGELLAARPDADPDAVAFHFQRAGDPRAARWLLHAGRQARQRFAPRTAIERLSEALSLAGHLNGTERVHARLERGRAYETIGSFEAAVADGEAARDLAREAGDAELEWRALLDLGAAWEPRDYERAGDHYRLALARARSLGDPAALAVSLNRLGRWHFNVLELDDALARHTQALTLLEELHDTPGVARTHDHLAMARWGKGDGIGADEHWQIALDLFELLGNRQALAASLATSSALSSIDFFVVAVGSPARDLERAARSLQIARAIGWQAGEIFALIARGCLLALRGELADALALLHEAQTRAEAIGHREWSATAEWAIGRSLLYGFAVEEARRHFERALTRAGRIGSVFWTRIIAAALAQALVEAGSLDRARAILDTHFGPFDMAGITSGSLDLAHERAVRAALALARGDHSATLQIVDTSLATLPNTAQGTIPQFVRLRARALAELGRSNDARQDLLAARETLARFEERPTRLVVCRELELLARELGRVEEAEEAGREARTLAEFIAGHLPVDAKSFRAGFAASIEELFTEGRGRPRPSAGALSEREIDVLRLVAEGLTDVQVAERLFLSRRTVSAHLRSIYTKLGVSTRTAATRLALELRLI
ncbi:MAG TPA: AAA family ATPase [Thermomicrobiaceae bacterium]|nr:AAA family ATPase [Thermomicrobiaceae bacterium]